MPSIHHFVVLLPETSPTYISGTSLPTNRDDAFAIESATKTLTNLRAAPTYLVDQIDLFVVRCALGCHIFAHHSREDHFNFRNTQRANHGMDRDLKWLGSKERLESTWDVSLLIHSGGDCLWQSWVSWIHLATQRLDVDLLQVCILGLLSHQWQHCAVWRWWLICSRTSSTRNLCMTSPCYTKMIGHCLACPPLLMCG